MTAFTRPVRNFRS